jgi:competence protein ComEC
VLRVSSRAGTLLLAGDLDAAAERELLARHPREALSADVVVIGRQAGSPGSSRQWIESLEADLAIATGGVAGSSTRARTIARWQAAGAHVLDTRRDGGIEIAFGTHGIAVRPPARMARYPFAWRRFE